MHKKNEQLLADLCASVQYTIIDVLTKKTLRAAKEFQVSSILLGGGVAANTFLQKTLQEKTLEQLPEATLFIPKREFCTDNAAMIAAAAYFQNTSTPWEEVTADPELYY